MDGHFELKHVNFVILEKSMTVHTIPIKLEMEVKSSKLLLFTEGSLFFIKSNLDCWFNRWKLW